MDAQTLLLVVAAVAPSAALLALLAWRGRPLSCIVPALVLGALASLPALVLERLLTVQPWEMRNLGVFVAFALIVAGLVEEGCKLAAFALGPARWREHHTDEYDSMLYAACVGLGFATVENIAYCLQGGLDTALSRAFTAVPAHTMFGLLLGAWLGRARARARLGWSTGGLVLTGFVLAVLAHGLYDVLALQGSAPATAALVAGLVGGAAWSISAVRAARGRSPAHGGIEPTLPPPLHAITPLAPAPPRRDPTKALLLGLLPGAGQAWNGESRKAVLFAGLAALNALLYVAACAFADAPDESLKALASVGLAPVLTGNELAAAVAQRHLLPRILGSALIAGVLLGALDAAWDAARSDQRRRGSYLAHGAVLSYVSHVSLALLLAFAPVIARAAAPASSAPAAAPDEALSKLPLQLTWVEKIDGWTPPRAAAKAAPAAKPTAAPTRALVVASPPAPRTPRAVGAPAAVAAPRTVAVPAPRMHDVPAPVVSRPSDVREATLPASHPPASRAGDGNDEGVGAASTSARDVRDAGASSGQDEPSTAAVEGVGWYSYNQYLSYRFHEGHEADVFFGSVSPEVWVVVRYEIDRSGQLLGVEVVESSGEAWEAALVPRLIRACAPFRPLPEGAARVTITELFWSREFLHFPPRSLAESLSQLPDGRLIR